MLDSKRSDIRQKVDAAQSRNHARAEPSPTDRAGETAVEAKDRLTSFAKEHPIALVVGGLAVGVLVSSFFRGSPTRKAGRAIGRKTAGLAAIAADLAVSYAHQAFAAAEEARMAAADKLSEIGETVSDNARSLSEDAGDYAAGAADAVRKAGKSASRSVRKRLP